MNETKPPHVSAKLRQHAEAFLAGEIDKWTFYEQTKWYRAIDVAHAADIPLGVVRMRRRDLRKMAPPRRPADVDPTCVLCEFGEDHEH